MKTHEYHYYMDAEKEEAYLNEQAAHGRALTGYFLWRYTFEDCAPGEYIYRIELLDGNAAKQKEYLDFLQDSGIECVQRWCDWVYLRRRAEEGAFELYSDKTSMVHYLQRLLGFYSVLISLEVFVCFFNFVVFLFVAHNPINLVCALILLLVTALLYSVRRRTQERLRALRTDNRIRE